MEKNKCKSKPKILVLYFQARANFQHNNRDVLGAFIELHGYFTPITRNQSICFLTIPFALLQF
jgi:hypothetical protein